VRVRHVAGGLAGTANFRSCEMARRTEAIQRGTFASNFPSRLFNSTRPDTELFGESECDNLLALKAGFRGRGIRIRRYSLLNGCHPGIRRVSRLPGGPAGPIDSVEVSSDPGTNRRFWRDPSRRRAKASALATARAARALRES